MSSVTTILAEIDELRLEYNFGVTWLPGVEASGRAYLTRDHVYPRMQALIDRLIQRGIRAIFYYGDHPRPTGYQVMVYEHELGWLEMTNNLASSTKQKWGPQESEEMPFKRSRKLAP